MKQSHRLATGTPLSGLARRSAILFFNFFLIILAYYQVKSASRSLLLEYWGASNFPYVWIISALVLGTFIGFYHRLVERHSRLNVVLGCLLLFIALLVSFRVLMGFWGAAASFGFYIFVDIFSVILVEQFWSLTNSINETEEGKKSYWLVGTGGLLGGVVGGSLGSLLIERTAMQTPDLLLTSALFLLMIFVLNLWMGRIGLYAEVPQRGPTVIDKGDWRVLLRSRYLLLIAAALLCAQMAQPVVEYQFISAVEVAYTEQDQRTIFFGNFFSILGLVSIGVNLILTPIIHRYFGVMAGLLTQPFILAVASFGFMLQPTLMIASAMKISDRGLSYSINRASKELLYIPVDPLHTYQAKAWIDMLGYRLFKVSGAALILLLTQWLPLGIGPAEMSWLTIAICAAWFGVLALLAREYSSFTLEPVAA